MVSTTDEQYDAGYKAGYAAAKADEKSGYEKGYEAGGADARATGLTLARGGYAPEKFVPASPPPTAAPTLTLVEATAIRRELIATVKVTLEGLDESGDYNEGGWEDDVADALIDAGWVTSAPAESA